MQSHLRKVHVYLAVTCHLYFWQNDWDLLQATVVTWGWNGHRNKCLHKKFTLWPGEEFFLLLLHGLEPVTFQSQVWLSLLTVSHCCFFIFYCCASFLCYLSFFCSIASFL